MKPAILLSCLLVSVSALGGVYELNFTRPFERAFVTIHVPSEVTVSAPAARLVGTTSCNGNTTYRFRILVCSKNLIVDFSRTPAHWSPSASISVRYSSRIQDANCDGAVNLIDLIFVRNYILVDILSANAMQADINLDGVINILDLLAIRIALW